MKTLNIIAIFCLFVSSGTVVSQVSTLGGNRLIDGRQQDRLIGPVRRIRVEVAKISIKDGKLIEGPKQLREITTYDIRGTRVDTVSQPIDISISTVPGKHQYRYDDKGNVIEMSLRGDDGSLLTRQSYQYQFDELGNWIKMTTSVAIYEEGKVGFEPTDVTYRTITYFYNQSVAKIAGNGIVQPTSVSLKQSTVPANATLVTTADSGAHPLSISAPPTTDSSPNPDKTAALDSKTVSTPATNEAPTAENSTSTDPVPTRTTTKRISEAELRDAAISLPQPEFPVVAELSGRNRKVEVQIVVDENGNVKSARGTSSEQILNEAAESAARKAKFESTKLSETPSEIFSVISYDFVSVPKSPPPVAASSAAEETAISNRTTADTRSLPAAPASSGSSLVPKNTYEQAISLLNAGRFTEAETAWKEFVYRNPDNAAGYSKLGLTYVALGKNEEAVIALNMAVKISPDQMDAQTYYLLGSSYNALGKYAEALKALQRAVYIARARSVEPGANVTENQVLFGIHYNLGLSYHGLKRAHQAIKELEDAIKLNPQSGEAHYALGMVQLSLGDRKSAEKQLGILKNLNVSLAKKLNEVIATGEIILPSRCRTVPCF